MKDYRDTQMPVEWDHDTYHQDDEKIYFYCPCCNDMLDVFSTDELNEDQIVMSLVTRLYHSLLMNVLGGLITAGIADNVLIGNIVRTGR